MYCWISYKEIESNDSKIAHSMSTCDLGNRLKRMIEFALLELKLSFVRIYFISFHEYCKKRRK